MVFEIFVSANSAAVCYGFLLIDVVCSTSELSCVSSNYDQREK